MQEIEENLLSKLIREAREKDETIEKATQIIQALQTELSVLKKGQDLRNKKEQNQRKNFDFALKKANLLEKNSKKPVSQILDDYLDKHCGELEKQVDFLEKKLQIERENNEELQEITAKMQKKISFLENTLENV